MTEPKIDPTTHQEAWDRRNQPGSFRTGNTKSSVWSIQLSSRAVTALATRVIPSACERGCASRVDAPHSLLLA